MYTIMMNSKNSNTSDIQRLLFNLPGKTNLKRIDKYLGYQILAYTIHENVYKNVIQK